MKLDVLKQKIDDLEYRLKLDNEGIINAEYNIKYAKRLGLTAQQYNNFVETSRYYATKIYNDQKAHNALLNCYNDAITSNSCNHNYFKCTFPYEIVSKDASYQTTLVVNENAVKLFANGIDYNQAIECLDNNDIIDIQSKFKMKPINDGISCNDIRVEAIGDVVDCSENIPITSHCDGFKGYKGLIASSEIPACFQIDKTTFKDLNGNAFVPEIPSLETIKSLQNNAIQKEKSFKEYKCLEYEVSKKMDEAINKINGLMNL